MGIIYSLVEIIASFLEGFIIAEFYREIFSRFNGKEYIKYNIGFGVAYMGCIRILNKIEIFSYVTALCAAMIILIYAVVIYKRRIVEALAVSCFYIMCMNVQNLICLSIFATISNNQLYEAVLYQKGIERILFIIVVQFIWVLLCILVKQLFKNLQVQYKFGYRTIVGIVMGTLGIVFLTNQTLSAFDIHLTFAWLFAVAVLMLIIFNVYAYSIDKENKAKLQISEMRNSLLEEKYQSIKENYKTNAKVYHDFKNHLNILNNYLTDKDIENAQKYIANIVNPIQKLSCVDWTGDENIDIVINYEIDKMNRRNITYDIQINMFKYIYINDYDFGILIGNLLDNAIEATEKVDTDGTIKFVMKQIHQFISIKVTNPCDKTLTFGGLYPETTKKEKRLHGWGFKNILEIVEKYDGSFECNNNEGIFEVNILLMNNEKEIR